jgi:hypothetical protein
MNRTPLGILVALIVVLGGCAAGEPASSPVPSPDATGSSPEPTMATTVSPSPSDAATTAAEPTATAAEPTPVADPLLAVELTDVRSGETFTLGALAAEQGPVLLEPMAVWCSSCRAQQHEVLRAHETGSFTSVSLDVELSELPEDLAAYADREGFTWYFAMADAELYRALQERFDRAVTHPPSTPLIVIGSDGTVRPLEFGRGVRSAEVLLDELAAG